ncbi:unnamed protein product [Schistocephalus solidus]|uniref:Uncharacterized protein n=1 Tax=Schistocephalus solidus TaxID=70667 RepID=A0A183SXA2_SCHSO|nr:unnamed protein product [Schistocephalus solidus]
MLCKPHITSKKIRRESQSLCLSWFAPSPTCGLIDSVMTPDSSEGGERESGVAAAQVYFHLKLTHVHKSPSLHHPSVEHTVEILELDGRTVANPGTVRTVEVSGYGAARRDPTPQHIKRQGNNGDDPWKPIFCSNSSNKGTRKRDFTSPPPSLYRTTLLFIGNHPRRTVSQTQTEQLIDQYALSNCSPLLSQGGGSSSTSNGAPVPELPRKGLSNCHRTIVNAPTPPATPPTGGAINSHTADAIVSDAKGHE